jgi:hypothetical protein
MSPRPILITTALNGAERIQGANSRSKASSWFGIRRFYILFTIHEPRTDTLRAGISYLFLMVLKNAAATVRMENGGCAAGRLYNGSNAFF